jgi:hypothetical protein
MRVTLPTQDTPYHHLARWISALDRRHPAEVFTTNYDLLMEQAFEECRVPYFDGFIGARRAFFDPTSIEQDEQDGNRLPRRWARLWKLHGSINWWQDAETSIVERLSEGKGAQLLIHPSHLKYQQSRRMPYLAMMDRLRAFLGSGQVVLVTCGYSFGDQHINDLILQGLGANPSAICFGLFFGDVARLPEDIRHCAKDHSNLALLAADGAIFGASDREWHCSEKPDEHLHGLAVQTGDLGARTTAPADRCKWLLGDFAAFGRFLIDQLSSLDPSLEPPGAP